MVAGEDEEWSDSEKTPSVSSGVEGGGSAVSSPIAPIVEEESSLPPPPRLNPPSSSVAIANSAAEDIRLRLSVLPEDARKRLASLTEDIEVNIRLSEKCLSFTVPSFTTMHFYTNMKRNLSNVVIFILIEQNGSYVTR